MFRNKRKKPLNGLIWTDGVIRSIEVDHNVVRLRLEDYCDKIVVVTLTGVSEAYVRHPLIGDDDLTSINIARERLSPRADHWQIDLLDDDLNTILTAVFVDGNYDLESNQSLVSV